MKKKILSILLSSLIIVGTVVPTFADSNMIIENKEDSEITLEVLDSEKNEEASQVLFDESINSDSLLVESIRETSNVEGKLRAINNEGVKEKNNYITTKDLYDRYIKATGGTATTQKYNFDYSKDAPIYEQLSIIKFTQTASGKLGGYALDVQGKVWFWGYNISGRGGLGLSETDLNYAGGMRRLPYFVDNDIKVVKIAAGYETAYALDSERNMYAWGRGLEGQMGNGTNAMVNTTPVKVNIPAKVVDFYPAKANQAHHVAAVDENGDTWFWGYGAGGRIPGGASYQSTPVKISAPTGVKFTKISPGDAFTIALAEDGTCWSMGNRAFGALGDGSTFGTTTSFNKISNLTNIVAIDTSYSRNVALDDSGNVYEWGQIFGGGPRGVARTISTPTKVKINDSEIAYVGYTPIPKKIFAGESVSFFIDQKGRSWAWGDGRYHGQAREGGYNTALDFRQTEAALYPRITGDGNTQFNDSSDKFPKYITGAGVPANRYRGYGINTLNPTAWDEKYMLKDEQGNVLDSEGNKLGFNSSTGRYYLAGTGTVAMPAIDPNEAWVGLTFLEPAQMVDISTERSSSVFLDTSGNIFKTSYDGAGSIAWGWDFETKYDDPDIGLNATRGIYNRYVYELVFMRGAPTMPQGSMSFVAPEGKVYKVDNTEKLTFTVKATVPEEINDPNLNLVVKPEFKSMEYIKIPYDMTNEDAYKYVHSSVALTNKDFEDLMSKGYEYGTVETKAENATLQTGNVDVNDNCIVVFRTISDVYGSESVGVDAYVVDNFYTPVEVLHNGVGDASVTIKDEDGNDIILPEHGGQKDQVVYDYTDENIKKTTIGDVNTTTVGVPLDANGKIITSVPDGSGGVKNDAPTYKYDTLSIVSYKEDFYSENGWDLVAKEDETIANHVITQPFELDGKYNDTELLESLSLKYTFNYEANPNIISKVDAEVIDIENPTERDTHFVYIRFTNPNGKAGRFFVFDRNYSETGTDKKPIDSFENGKVIGVFESDGNGVLDTRNSSELTIALNKNYAGEEYVNDGSDGKVHRDNGIAGGRYPIDVVFQEGTITEGQNFGPGQKLLSNIVKGEIPDSIEQEITSITIDAVDEDMIFFYTDVGAKVRVYDAQGEIIGQLEETLDDDLQYIEFTEVQEKAVKLVLQSKVEGKLSNSVITYVGK
ncbi:MAG: hypothetical protein GXZ08_06280 [Tissierellia bacterium]|nr:hypothetical protein [Tissierellia bacterium]